jgi:RNA polymerase sigma-70 factor (ECF subfamily)
MNVIEHIKVKEGYKDSTAQGLEGDQHTSVDQSIVNELEQKIKETIDLLPPERRKVFMMSRYEGLKYREIAEELNISIKTVENQMYQALSFMRENLKDYLPLILWLIFLRMGK